MKKTLVVLLGLPRSGTTMATAMFDVHPDISAWFEPWHTRKEPKAFESVDDFIEQYQNIFGSMINNKNVLMFKETSSNIEAIKWTEKSISNCVKNADVDVKIIWLLRDIHHAYLSRVHTAREHWGHSDMKIDTKSFKNYIDLAYKGFSAIEEITSEYDSCKLSYEKLVSEPKDTLIDVMNFLGLELHPNQLEYHLHLKRNKSAGDPGVTKNPKPITTNKTQEKDAEWSKYKDVFLNSLDKNEADKYRGMVKIITEIREKGFVNNQ